MAKICKHCGGKFGKSKYESHLTKCEFAPENEDRHTPPNVPANKGDEWKFETYIPPLDGVQRINWLERRVKNLEESVFDLQKKVDSSTKLAELIYKDFPRLHEDITPFVLVQLDMWKNRLIKAQNDLEHQKKQLEGSQGKLF